MSLSSIDCDCVCDCDAKYDCEWEGEESIAADEKVASNDLLLF